MIPIHGRMRQHDLETVIKCVFSVFNTPNATSATMVDSSKKPVTMTVTVSQSQSPQQRQPKTRNRHFPTIPAPAKDIQPNKKHPAKTGCRRFKSCQPDENRWKQRRFRRFEKPFPVSVQNGINMATQKNLMTFCDVHMVSSVWVFKRKWYGWHLIVEFEQDTGAVWRD